MEEAKLYLEHTSKDDFNLEEHQKENRYKAIQVVLKEIERLNNIINSFLAYLKGNEEHWKDTSYNWDSLIYGELAQRLEMKIKMSLEGVENGNNK